MLLVVYWNRAVLLLEPFPLERCSYTLTRGCALYRADDNFPGILQVLMLSFTIKYSIFQRFKMLLVVFWN